MPATKVATLSIPNVAGVLNYLNGRLYVAINTPLVQVLMEHKGI